MSAPLVVATDEQDRAIDLARWQDLARASLLHEGVRSGELNLLFVDAAEMARLNQHHMGEEGPTDVLSFPLDASEEDPIGERLIGDVVICPEYAEARAGTNDREWHDGSLDDELALLVVHGVLHVLGHDHAEPAEAELMRAREDALLAAYHRR